MNFLSRLFGGGKAPSATPQESAEAKGEQPAQQASGSPMQPKLEDLLAELIAIGSTEGFISNTQRRGKFDAKGDNIRAREIGSLIHRIGKTELMKEASVRVSAKLGPVKTKQLSYVWLGIGDWKV